MQSFSLRDPGAVEGTGTEGSEALDKTLWHLTYKLLLAGQSYDFPSPSGIPQLCFINLLLADTRTRSLTHEDCKNYAFPRKEGRSLAPVKS